MDSSDIYDILQEHEASRKCLGGILPSDKLPPRPKRVNMNGPVYFVVNLDPSDKPGSHWVVCFLKKSGFNIYFDSYGFPPVIDSIKDFMGTNFVYNKKQVQHPLSTACGQWCIFFILHQLLKSRLADGILSFSERFGENNLLRNDHEINHWINKCFGTRHKVIQHDFLHSQIAKAMIQNRSELEHLYE